MIPDLTQWDVVRVRIRPADKDLHPAVVLSRAAVCADSRKQTVNVLYGSTKRPAVAASQTDVVVNSAEGLDRLTLINCDHIYTVRKESIELRLGRVSHERRRILCRTIGIAFALGG
jgi:mRNA-degrading endonuclease toxin of MazEF toxin-antitoxin module